MPNESFAPRLNTGQLLARVLQLRELLFRAIHVCFSSTAEREQLLLPLQVAKRCFDFGPLLFCVGACRRPFSFSHARVLLGRGFGIFALLSVALYELKT